MRHVAQQGLSDKLKKLRTDGEAWITAWCSLAQSFVRHKVVRDAPAWGHGHEVLAKFQGRIQFVWLSDKYTRGNYVVMQPGEGAFVPEKQIFGWVAARPSG